MNEKNRRELAYIRELSSEEAATYLIENHSYAPVIMKHRSWKKPDQIRLSKAFVQGQVHATYRVYSDFLSFMSITLFLKVVEEGLAQIDPDRLDLLYYYFNIALGRAAKTEKQIARAKEFLVILEALIEKRVKTIC